MVIIPDLERVWNERVADLAALAHSCVSPDNFGRLAVEVVEALKHPLGLHFNGAGVFLFDPVAHVEHGIIVSGALEGVEGGGGTMRVFPFTFGNSYVGALRLRMDSSQQLGDRGVVALRLLSHILGSGAGILTLARRSDLDRKLGIANSESFRQHAREQLVECRRGGHPCCVVFIDVDDFKRVNDGYGEQFGDDVLKGIAQALDGTVRAVGEGALAARYGGEEFVVVLPRFTIDGAVELARGVNERVRSLRFVRGDEQVRVTVSAGVSGYPTDGDTVGELIEAADTAKTMAKWEGKDRTKSFLEFRELDPERRLQLQEDDRRRKYDRSMREYFESRRARLWRRACCASLRAELEILDRSGDRARGRCDFIVRPLGGEDTEFVWELSEPGRIGNVCCEGAEIVGGPTVAENGRTVWLELRMPAAVDAACLTYDVADGFRENTAMITVLISPFSQPVDVVLEVRRSFEGRLKGSSIEPSEAREAGNVSRAPGGEWIRYSGDSIPPTIGRIALRCGW